MVKPDAVVAGILPADGTPAPDGAARMLGVAESVAARHQVAALGAGR